MGWPRRPHERTSELTRAGTEGGSAGDPSSVSHEEAYPEAPAGWTRRRAPLRRAVPHARHLEQRGRRGPPPGPRAPTASTPRRSPVRRVRACGGRRAGRRGGSASSSQSARPASSSGRSPASSSWSAPARTGSSSSSARSSSPRRPRSSGSRQSTPTRARRDAAIAFGSSRSSRAGSTGGAAASSSSGTLLFNLDTFHALQEGLDADAYDRLVWSPDALGSLCFLVSGYLAYAEVSGGYLRPHRRTLAWWIAAINLLGCIAFGISAVAAYWVPTEGSLVDLAAANAFTAFGGLCFLVGAVLLLPESAAERSG